MRECITKTRHSTAKECQAVASKLAGMLPEMYRVSVLVRRDDHYDEPADLVRQVLLIEPHTHFHHLFAFVSRSSSD